MNRYFVTDTWKGACAIIDRLENKAAPFSLASLPHLKGYCRELNQGQGTKWSWESVLEPKWISVYWEDDEE